MAEWLRFRDLPKGAAGPEAPRDFDPEVSPYNRPDAIRAYVLPNGRVRFEVRYIDGPEKTMTHEGGIGVLAHIGRHTKRLFALDFDPSMFATTAEDAEAFKRWIDTQWDEMVAATTAPSDNEQQVRKIMVSRHRDLFTDFKDMISVQRRKLAIG